MDRFKEEKTIHEEERCIIENVECTLHSNNGDDDGIMDLDRYGSRSESRCGRDPRSGFIVEIAIHRRPNAISIGEHGWKAIDRRDDGIDLEWNTVLGQKDDVNEYHCVIVSKVYQCIDSFVVYI